MLAKTIYIQRCSVKLFIGFAASAAILVFLYFQSDLNTANLLEELTNANKPLLVITIFVSIAFQFLVGAHKLWKILLSLKVKMPYRELLKICLGTRALRIFMPFKFSGDVINILYLWRQRYMSFTDASGAVIFDKGLNGIGTFFWLLIGICLMPELPMYGQVTVFIAAIAAYLAIFFCAPVQRLFIHYGNIFHTKAGTLISSILTPFLRLSLRRKIFFMVYGILFQLSDLVLCYLLFRVYGIRPNAIHIIVYASTAIMLGLIPLTPIGIGPREAAIVTLFGGYASSNILFSIGLLMTLTMQIIPMLVGIPWSPRILEEIVVIGEQKEKDRNEHSRILEQK